MLSAPRGIPPYQDHLYRVPVQSAPRHLRRHEQILLAAFDLHKTEALRMANICANKCLPIRFSIFSLGIHCQPSLRQQFFQQTAQFLAVLPGHLQQHGQFLFLHRHILIIFHEFTYNLFSLIRCNFLHILHYTINSVRFCAHSVQKS